MSPILAWLVTSAAYCHSPGVDKVCHAAISGLGTYAMLGGEETPSIGRALVVGGFMLTIGIGKEVVDHISYGSTVEQSSGDLAADLAGVAIAIGFKWSPKPKVRKEKQKPTR